MTEQTNNAMTVTAPKVTNSTVPEEQLQSALLKAIGFDKLSPEQRELALTISRQYDLDPMLRHLVLVDGKPYITRDGLLHVAHKSGDFDGIEVEQPALDSDGKYWRTWATVYRKSFARPFRYPGRYPATSGNVKYNEEMAIKVAEVMTLRRAFDVAAPVIEERWDGDTEEVEPVVVSTVVDKIAARAAALGGPVTNAEVVVGERTPEIVVSPPAEAIAVEVVEQEPATTPDEPIEVTNDGPTFDEFKELVSDLPQTTVKRVTKELYPEVKKFSELTPPQMKAIVDALVEEEAADDDEPTGDLPETIATPLVEPVVADEAVCGQVSPYGGEATCTMAKGHPGAHRAGAGESW